MGADASYNPPLQSAWAGPESIVVEGQAHERTEQVSERVHK